MARVLIIDDDDMIRKLLEEHLSNEGYETISVPSADEGYDLALQDPPDLILLDVNLPDATGFQMCGWFRESPVTQSIPIIMMTGAARWPNQQEIGRRMGANAYVLKPFDVIELGNRVHTLMGAKRPVQKAPILVSIHSANELTPAPPLLLTAPAPKPPVVERISEKVIPLPAARSEQPQDDADQRFSDFSVDVLILVSRLPRTRAGRHTADQLLKCGTAVGARINESLLSDSANDRLLIRRAALKNLRETGYWLMLIRKSGLIETPSVEALETKCRQLSDVLAEEVLAQKQNA